MAIGNALGTLLKWYAVYAASLAALLGVAAIVQLPAIEWGVLPLGIAWLMTFVRAFWR